MEALQSTQTGPEQTNTEYDQHGIKLVCASQYVMECKECGQQWAPLIQTGGRRPQGWWKCPNGCNVET
jgi:hypothetical protein